MLDIRPLFMCARGKARAMLLSSEFPDQAGLAADALPDTRGTFEPQVHMEGAVSGIPLQACHEDGAVAAHGDRGCIHAVIAQSVFGNFSFYSYKKACGQKKTVRGSKNSRRLSNGTPAI